MIKIAKNIIITSALFFLCNISVFAFQNEIKSIETSEGLAYFNKSVAIFQDNLDSAIYYMELAHPLLKQEKDWAKHIECFSALSFFHHTNNDFDSSRFYAELAIVEAEKYLEPTNIKFGDIFNNLNAIYSRNGNSRKGIELLHKSLKVRKLNNENEFQLSFAYQNLGAAYSKLGDSKKGLEYLIHALEMRVKSDSIPEYDVHFADSYSAIADAYRIANQYDKAISYYLKSLLVLNNDKCPKSKQTLNLKIIALQQIAENLMLKGNSNKSFKYLEEVLEIYETGINIRHPTSLYLLSRFYLQKGEFDKALSLAIESQKNAKENNNENAPPLTARRYKLIGDINKKKNKMDEALDAYDAGLFALGFLMNDQDYNAILAKSEALKLMSSKSDCLSSIAQSVNTKEAWIESFESYLKTIRLIREMRSGIITAESKNTLAANSMEIYEQALETAYNILKIEKDEGVLKSVFEIIESNKALLLLESYNKQLALGSLNIPEEILDLEYDLKVDRSYYAKEVTLEMRKEDKDVEKIKDLRFNLQIANQKYDSLIYAINKFSPDFNQYKNQLSPIAIPNLMSNLSETNSVILEYFYGEHHLFLMVITDEKIEFLKLNKENLGDNIYKLKNELSYEATMVSGNTGFDRFYNISNKLYQQLIEPIIPYLNKNQSNIIIIPDGYISSVPFDILISGHNEDVTPDYSSNYLNYLINDYNISYSYSSALLAKNQSPSEQKSLKNLITFAPIFNEGDVAQERNCVCDDVKLQKLKCNVSESESIANIFSGKSYTAQSANREVFLSDAKNYEVIHIASHACVDQEDGMLNQIFLSDGGLTNYEIYNSNLNAEMTVLSACNTGIGEIQNGEGVLNLAKGFLMAGSKSTLMSLWSVNDCTTSKLMQSFYTNLKKGSTRNEAIREAKIDFLANATKLHAHPYYWGAFVHYGKNEPLNLSNSFAIFYWGALIILLACLLGFFFKKYKLYKISSS